jgi:hypothetical protein
LNKKIDIMAFSPGWCYKPGRSSAPVRARNPLGEPLVRVGNATGTNEGGFSIDSVVLGAKPTLKALTNRV